MAKKKIKATTTKRTIPTASRREAESIRVSKDGAPESTNGAMIFGKQNYLLMVVGVGLILGGMLLMVGGDMPDANTWDDDIIYSFRITVLAPIVILAGLITEIYAIFKE